MYFITKDKVREAFRALRAEGYPDPKFETVLEQLGGGSKTTLGKYYGPIKAEFEAMDISGAEPECNHTGGSMPLAQETGAQVTAPASEPTAEEQYHADIARLEAAVQAAEVRYDQADKAMWAQAQHYAKVQAIDAAGGFRLARYAQPDRWTNTPKTEKEAMERRIEARAHALADIEKARAAITQRQVQWRAACWEAAFLATPEAQFITRNLEETLAALEAAKASNQSDMVGVLARRRDSLEKQLDAARRERHLSEERDVTRSLSAAAAAADHRAREKRGV